MFAKQIILVAILLSLKGIILHKIEQINIMKYVSINSDIYETKFEIKIIKEKNKDCGKVDTVNLNDMNLKNVKNDIIRSETIRQILLENNLLENVPSNILDYIPYLTCLNLHRNRINLYNGDIVAMQHSHLQVLNLSDQNMFSKQVVDHRWEIDDIAEETEDLYKHMVFNSSGISLPNLEHLDLSRNDLSALSWDFNISFPRLTHLYLTNIYAEKIEPNFFNKIPSSLRVLHLENNQFHNLSMRNLMDVTAIYLNGNTKLKNIEISSSKLRILSLSNCFCQLQELSFIKLDTPYLEQLDLTRNNLNSSFITHLRFDNYQTLQILLLDNNKLTTIPFLNLQRLTELSLNYNMIRHVPSKRFEQLQLLKKLSLKGNNIESIKNDSFLGLRKLEYLDLSANKLRTLPHYWLLPMMTLQYLNVNSNQFTNISDIAITYPVHNNYLKHLFVKNHTFSKIISTMDLELLPPNIIVHIA